MTVAHQNASGGGLSGDEFARPVLGLGHPADLAVRRPVAGQPPARARLARHGGGSGGGGDRLLAEQPRQNPPRQHEQQAAEERDEAGAEERVPVRVAHALLLGQRPVIVGRAAVARPDPGHACRRHRAAVAAVNHLRRTVPTSPGTRLLRRYLLRQRLGASLLC